MRVILFVSARFGQSSLRVSMKSGRVLLTLRFLQVGKKRGGKNVNSADLQSEVIGASTSL